jgi:hypothetical protein
VRLSGVLLGGAAVALALSAAAAPPAAGHPDKKACIAASESAQKLRHDGKLRAAREQLLLCAKTECPAIVRADCGQWLNEVVSATPSVVVAARDTNGKETLAVKVSIDGELALPKLDGKSFAIDPGVHQLKYEMDDGMAIDEEVAIREGEKNRVLYVNFHKPAPPDSAAAPAAPASAPAASGRPATTIVTSRPGIPAGAWVFGALGVVGVGVGTYLFLGASSDVSDLQHCAPLCKHSDVDAARTKALVADVAFGAAGVAVAAALWMALVRPSERVETATARVHWDVGPAAGGASAGVHGAF